MEGEYYIYYIYLIQSGEEEEQVEKTRSTRSHDEDDRFAPWSWEQVSSSCLYNPRKQSSCLINLFVQPLVTHALTDSLTQRQAQSHMGKLNQITCLSII